MADKTLTCRNCGKDFVFTAGEQDFYTSHQLIEPRHCPECRANRRKERAAKDGEPVPDTRPSFNAICASCGAETTVPFEPVEGRPVYCKECYFKNKPSRRTSDSSS